jgi:hypothetical protein
MENDLHARAQLLARARLGRIGVPGPWGSSGLVTGADHLNLTLVQRETGFWKATESDIQNWLRPRQRGSPRNRCTQT